MKRAILATFLTVVAAASFAAVDVNKANEADLNSIKGVGPGTSSKIVEQRKGAPFKSWADLIKRVPGIGEKRASGLSQQGLTVNGESFKPTSAKPETPATTAPKK
ncbi:MAG: helix-hairpin-helix domain-containing protein [Hydrogenophaga sp.]|uniref:ComEA family DNA-binding protein n=1 Tax=Hydrogenophaga sp. TaxID=1904254 RepID=UPI001D4B7989|nr:helix-hairpin-helix domain-containing protein [Hydrogenophaga sp.]MBX3609746.1 helix-hairpin-helix domain-containing protein [Hydrogenophaga sp.]